MDVLTQLSNNPALQRQINPLSKGVAVKGSVVQDENTPNHVTSFVKDSHVMKNISSVCIIL